ncbi:MAG: NAD(P)/FAD-dependent oxidoreductase [Alphaproteobacteria bacterium]|nr:NAD(P)/FAD-dependent oxidoreductase [Alphaproteobacteria bacterium]
MRRFDLIIVGGSFAGLACARTAALRGLKVAVVERKRDPGERVRTTGILVKEAAEEMDVPSHLTRLVRGVRLYAPNGKFTDHSSAGYYFLTTDTPNLLRWMADEATRAGAEMLLGAAFKRAEQDADAVTLPDLDLSAGLLVGADGATSAVGRAFGLDANRRFLGGVEFELEPEPALDGRFLHCFLDSELAPGYIAWAAPSVGVTQVGLAARHGVRPDARAFLEVYRKRLGLPERRIVARRSGLIPAGATLAHTHVGRVMLIGDAAGHVSPLTGGGIVQTLRLGRRTAQLAADWINAGGEHPALALAREAPRFRTKLWLRRMLDLAPPNWVWNLALGTAPFRAFAQTIYFHQRGDVAAAPEMPDGGRKTERSP